MPKQQVAYLFKQNCVHETLKSETPKITEDQIIALLRQKDKEGMRWLYRSYGKVVFGVICRIVKMEDIAENVLQDALLKVWNNIESYDLSKGRFLSWILKIARNTAIDKVRSKTYQQSLKSHPIDPAMSSDPRFATTPDTAHIDVRNKVGNLEEKYRQLIEMTYFEGYTHVEVAERLELPLGTVKGRIRKALSELRKVLRLFF